MLSQLVKLFQHDHLNLFSLLAFYKNCLLDLVTHRSDVEYALNTIYEEHYEDIDLTPFLKAMCSHLSIDDQKYDFEFNKNFLFSFSLKKII